LDLLRTELKQLLVISTTIGDTIDLVEDIFAASGSAISILNDLLNYEHIDAGNVCYLKRTFNRNDWTVQLIGTFKLEMEYLPLLRLFDDKLNWARLMARSKGIAFSVEDATDATESGFQASLDRNQLLDDSSLERMEG